MASLTTIATELVDAILTFLETKDLCSVTLTSSWLREIAEPHLYRSMNWTWTPESDQAPRRFLQSILRRPRLAEYVTQLSITRGEGFYDAGADSVSPETVSLMRNRMQSAEHFDTWIADHRSSAPALPVILILSQLVNLKTLHFSTGVSSFSEVKAESRMADGYNDIKLSKGTSILYPIHLLTANPPPTANTTRFHALRSVHIRIVQFTPHPDCTLPDPSLSHALSVLFAPNLHTATFTLRNLDLPHRLHRPSIWQNCLFAHTAPAATNLTSLRFENCVLLDEPLVADVLSRAPNLRGFVYDNAYPVPHPAAAFDGAVLRHALLRHCAATLTELRVRVGACEAGIQPVQALPGPEVVAAPLGDLRGLVELRVVEVDVAVLLGWDGGVAGGLGEVVPGGVREVVVRSLFGWWREARWGVEEVVGVVGEWVKEGGAPGLERVGLVVGEEEREGVRRSEMWGRLVEECERRGVRCEIR